MKSVPLDDLSIEELNAIINLRRLILTWPQSLVMIHDPILKMVDVRKRAEDGSYGPDRHCARIYFEKKKETL